MSKSNPKSNNKAIKKTARKDIETILIAELKTITDKFGITSKKATKVINAGAKKLAKKFAKEVKIVKAAATEKAESVVAVPAAAPAVKPAAKKAKAATEVKA
jgi:ribosomal silencing factor RsfS